MKAYIYAPLPEEVHSFFPKNRGGDDDAVPHITVLYVGEIADDEVKILKDVLASETQKASPIRCRFGKLKSFPTGKYGVPWYVEVDAEPELERLHKELRGRLEDAGIKVEHQWRDYVPHATLKYLPEGEEYDGAVPSGSFTIKAVELDLQ